ncbi:MAG: hypothetical protein F9K42_10690, partial [Ignavibacterium sp.]
MKKIPIILIFFTLCLPVFSQTEDTVKNFMPLAIGNEYQYVSNNNPDYRPFGIIEKDTLREGKLYYKIPNPLPFFGLVRKDTLGNIWSIGNVNIPYPANQEKEYLIIDINKELSEPWTIYEN